jgi:hypothetical protein
MGVEMPAGLHVKCRLFVLHFNQNYTNKHRAVALSCVKSHENHMPGSRIVMYGERCYAVLHHLVAKGPTTSVDDFVYVAKESTKSWQCPVHCACNACQKLISFLSYRLTLFFLIASSGCWTSMDVVQRNLSCHWGVQPIVQGDLVTTQNRFLFISQNHWSLQYSQWA